MRLPGISIESLGKAVTRITCGATTSIRTLRAGPPAGVTTAPLAFFTKCSGSALLHASSVANAVRASERTNVVSLMVMRCRSIRGQADPEHLGHRSEVEPPVRLVAVPNANELPFAVLVGA